MKSEKRYNNKKQKNHTSEHSSRVTPGQKQNDSLFQKHLPVWTISLSTLHGIYEELPCIDPDHEMAWNTRNPHVSLAFLCFWHPAARTCWDMARSQLLFVPTYFPIKTISFRQSFSSRGPAENGFALFRKTFKFQVVSQFPGGAKMK